MRRLLLMTALLWIAQPAMSQMPGGGTGGMGGGRRGGGMGGGGAPGGMARGTRATSIKYPSANTVQKYNP
ncbi:MAG: hypothetical protein ACYC7F_03730, partial [Gemmatimonadaceae bacterium]